MNSNELKPLSKWEQMKDKTLSEFFTRPVRYIAIGLVVFALLAFLAACGTRAAEPFQDADRGTSNTAPANTITMPDGFSNVAYKCDGPNMVYVLFKGDLAYGGIAVVPNDPRCGS